MRTELPLATRLRLEREAQLAAMVCRGCGTVGLTETVAAHGPHSAWLTCEVCPWSGPEDVARRATTTRQDVVDMLAEDQHRGEPGGGSSSKFKRAVKPGDRLLRRPEQDDPPVGPDKPEVKTEVVETKTAVLRCRVALSIKVEWQSEARRRGLSESELLLEAVRAYISDWRKHNA